MKKLVDEIKKQGIKSQLKTHFFTLNNIFSIFVFIFLFSSSVSIGSYVHHLTISTNYIDRHYIFLICNGILVFLIMSFDSTHVSSVKENQSVITHAIKPQSLLMSSAMKQAPAMEKQEEGIEEDDDEIGENGSWVLICDHNSISTNQDHLQDQEAEHCLAVVEEHETGESNGTGETEEFNKRCAEFIRKMRERMKFESSIGQSRLPPTKINPLIMQKYC